MTTPLLMMMNKSFIKYYFFSLVLFLQFLSYGQSNDFGVWSTLSLQKKISEKLRVSFEEELRLFENSSRINCYLSDISITYKPIKKINLSAGYRFTTNLDDLDLQEYYQHRYYIGASFKFKYHDFDLIYRTQLQDTYESVNRSKYGHLPKLIERNKIQILYNIYNTPLAPYISGELFYQFNYLGEEGFNKMRYSIGLEYKINTRNQLDGYFMIEQRFNTYKQSKNFIAGIKYAYAL